MSTAESYEEVPYPRRAYPQTHPARLGAIATVLGMTPAPAGACRVIELGCGSGDNLIPLAAAFPGSRFVGVDFSDRQIAMGRAVAEQLGLENLRLEARGIESLGAADGEFDFILCHGVYSWVPEPVRRRVLEICRKNLSREGVALVSYNALPGWHMDGALRDMALFHTRHAGPPLERVEAGHRLIEFLQRATPDADSAWAKMLRARGDALRRYPLDYIYHDHFEVVNTPFLFVEFARRAADAGLQVLGDARVAATWIGGLAPEARQRFESWTSDPIELQQYMDFLVNRMLRHTLLCRSEVALLRAPDPGRLDGLHVASRLEVDPPDADLHASGEMTFRKPGASERVRVAHPIEKAAMVALSERWPASLPFAELFVAACERLGVEPGDDTAQIVAVAERLADTLTRCWLRDQVELFSADLPVTSVVSERPEACAAARVLAREGTLVPTRLHDSLDLSDVSRLVLGLLDGRRDRESLIDRLAEQVQRGDLVDRSSDAADDAPEAGRASLVELLDTELAFFADSGLLVG